MSYNLVQTFFVNSSAVNGSSQVLLTSVDLYVKKKPNRSGNKSGLTNPSIVVQICPATRDAPDLTNMVGIPLARATWDEVVLSADGSTPTRFTFDAPITLPSDAYYGIYVQLMDDDYELWQAVQGHALVGTNTPTAGPSGRYDGYLFEGSSDTTFRAISDRDLKFGVSVARFSANTTANVGFVAENYEFLTISQLQGTFLTRERVFQDASKTGLAVPVYADLPGTLTINANSTRIVGNNTTFTTTLAANGFVILSDTRDLNNFAIAVVNNVINNTVLFLKEAAPITTNAFSGSYRTGPIAAVFESRPYFNKTNEIILFRSSANSTAKFVTGGLGGVTVSNTGAGYSNTNIVRVVNPTGVDATYTITTNGSGTITSLRVINPGSGFQAPVSNVRIEVSSVDPTLKAGNPGANAVVSVANNQIGLTLRGHLSEASANIISVDNKSISEIWPQFQEINSVDGSITVNHAFSNGAALGVSAGLYRPTILRTFNALPNYPATLASRSNEQTANSGPSSRFNVVFKVNKDAEFLFETPVIESERATVETYENDINNDATNEHTNSGNAISKYIGKRIGFDQDAVSEDLVVYVKGQRPAGSDIKVYAKFHNSIDDEPFDDKLWTELEKTTPDVFTNPYDKTSTTTIGYTIPQYPVVESTLPGVVATANNSANVDGVGTSFNSTLIGRTIRIWSPLNVANHQVASVIAVANTTRLTLGAPVVNNSVQESVVGSGLKMDLLSYTGTAFNNILNDNVARYYTLTNQAEIDGFDTFAIKIVLLSANKYIVPSVEDIRMVGVSA